MNQPTETHDTPRPGTTHPHLARERALKVLFAADVRQVDPRVLLDEVAAHPADLELLDELEPDQEQVAGDEELQRELTRRRRLPVDDYTRTLVSGVAAHQQSIDTLLEDVADRWPVHRMPSVDRNLLRMAVYELAEQDTPHPVVIDEAVALSIAFAGEKARSFVNGVLETVRKRVVAGDVDLQAAPWPVDAPAAESVDEPEPPIAGQQGTGERAAGEAPASSDEELSHGALDEVDEAASAAYDLALDLLDAEGPLETGPDDDADVVGPDDEALSDDGFDGPARAPADEAASDDPPADEALDAEERVDVDVTDLRDEDDALW